MKHHKLITRKPLLAQTTATPAGSPYEAKMTFKVNLVDRAVIFAFQTFGQGGIL